MWQLNILKWFAFMLEGKFQWLLREIKFVCKICFRGTEQIPLSFLTGFYVTQVVSRYWDQFMSLPWPDRIAFKLVSYIPGKVSEIQTLFTNPWIFAQKFVNSKTCQFRKINKKLFRQTDVILLEKWSSRYRKVLKNAKSTFFPSNQHFY